MQHSTGSGYGENIYMKWSSDPNVTASGGEAVQSWYSEISKYTYGSGFSMGTGIQRNKFIRKSVKSKSQSKFSVLHSFNFPFRNEQEATWLWRWFRETLEIRIVPVFVLHCLRQFLSFIFTIFVENNGKCRSFHTSGVEIEQRIRCREGHVTFGSNLRCGQLLSARKLSRAVCPKRPSPAILMNDSVIPWSTKTATKEIVFQKRPFHLFHVPSRV